MKKDGWSGLFAAPTPKKAAKAKTPQVKRERTSPYDTNHPLIQLFHLEWEAQVLWAILIEARGEVVSQEKLTGQFGSWAHAIVRMNHLRKALGTQEKEKGRGGLITHPKEGYSFRIPSHLRERTLKYF